MAWPPVSISRISRPTGPSLGSRVPCAGVPCAFRCSTSRRTCVVVPAPSRPSMTIRRALTPAVLPRRARGSLRGPAPLDERGREQTERAEHGQERGVQHPDRLLAAARAHRRFLRRLVVGAERVGLAEVRAAVLALRLERLAERE